MRLELPKRDNLLDLYLRIVVQEGLLERIVPGEEEGICDYIITLSNGSLRELVNIMEKVIVYFSGSLDKMAEEPITVVTCRSLFLTRIYQSFHEYILQLRQGKLEEAIATIYSVVANGYSIIDIFDFFFVFLKSSEIITQQELFTETEKYEITKVLCKYITIIHNVHEETIEMVLFTNHVYKVLEKTPH